MLILQDKDKFTLDNTIGFDQSTLDKMNVELSEHLEFISAGSYNSAVRHEKFHLLIRYYNKIK
jgi:hypothetical protein